MRLTIEKHHVVSSVRESGEDFERPSSDESGSLRRNSSFGEGLTRCSRVLGLVVDRGQHPVTRHAPEQPEARDACSRPHFCNGAGLDRLCEPLQRRTSGRDDRARTNFVTSLTSSAEYLVFGAELVNELPYGIRVGTDRQPPRPR